MTPKRPYILRALYEWLVDNELTPHLVVDAQWPHTYVPRQYVQDGQIVLNVAPGAVQSLQMSNDTVQFFARFNGVEQKVVLPLGSLLALYARENGAGTIFEPEEAYIAEAEAATEAEAEGKLQPVESSASETSLTDGDAEQADSQGKANSAAGKKKGPSLRVVK